jgi:hypothetical protein
VVFPKDVETLESTLRERASGMKSTQTAAAA